jgi:hypothetical protein
MLGENTTSSVPVPTPKKLPPIQVPEPTLESLVRVVKQLKAAVEALQKNA